jgi:hypothetical protein
MDIGRDVLTRTLIGSTDSEKVFTPWWVTLHHYLVYTLVILGRIQTNTNVFVILGRKQLFKPTQMFMLF